jgi:hypothetical protein
VRTVHRVTVTNKTTGEVILKKDLKNAVSASMYADELDGQYARSSVIVHINMEPIQVD